MFPIHQPPVSNMATLNDICARNSTNPLINANLSSNTSLNCYNEDISCESFIPCTNSSLYDTGFGQVLYNQLEEVQSSLGCELLMTTNCNTLITNGSNPTYQAEKLMGDTGYLPDCRRKNQGDFLHRRSQKFIPKRKRRTVFNTEQILTLEKIFNKRPYVSREERAMLKERLNVNERVIKVWFQNRRRLSGKREIESTFNYISDSSGDENENLNLEYVQSKINTPDEFGFVTLDDRAMKELITVVDSFLTDVDLDEYFMECNSVTDRNIANYEPISPVSIHDDGDEEEKRCLLRWEPYEPEESLRRLFDVQALITK